MMLWSQKILSQVKEAMSFLAPRISRCLAYVIIPAPAHFEITQMTVLAPVPLFQLPTEAEETI